MALRVIRLILMGIGALACLRRPGYLGLTLLADRMLGGARNEIVQSLTSPDKIVTATVIDTSGGATTPVSYEVRLAAPNAESEDVLFAYRSQKPTPALELRRVA